MQYTVLTALVTFILTIVNPEAVDLNLLDPLVLTEEKRTDIYSPMLPSLDQIFHENHTWTATLSAHHLRTIIATGDVIPARSVNSQVIRRNDFTWPYQKTSELTRNADLTFINLETPLIDVCPVTVEGLVYAGVDLASIANNHAANHGEDAVTETIDHLRKNSIDVTGVSGPVVKDIRGVTFSFLGYNDISKPQPGISNAEEEKIRKEIAAAKKISDVVVVTYHWGVEYRDQPDTDQLRLGRMTIDAGADLVIGNHPHWIQPVEIYRGKLITYAHGNFVFDQMWSEKTKEGVVGKYTFYDNQLIDVEYTPIKIEQYGQPYIMTSPHKERIINEMKTASDVLQRN